MFRRFCYVIFETAESAKRAESKPLHIIDNLMLRCQMSKPAKVNCKKLDSFEQKQLAGTSLHVVRLHESAKDCNQLGNYGKISKHACKE